MAQTTNRVTARSQLLRYDHAMIDDLLEITAEEEEVPENEWQSFMHEWDQLAYEHIPRLSEYAANGEFTAAQEIEYRRLIHRIKEQSSLIRKHGLAVPEIPAEAGAEQ